LSKLSLITKSSKSKAKKLNSAYDPEWEDILWSDVQLKDNWLACNSRKKKSIYNGSIVPHFFPWLNSSQWARASLLSWLHHHTQDTTHSLTPLDESSAQCRNLYLTTHNRQTDLPPVAFKPVISASKPLQTHALDQVGPGINQ
jgi:hypothetical protein